MNVLVDTNVWIDIALKRADFADFSELAVGICLNEGITVSVSATSLKDIFYLVSKWKDTNTAYSFLETMFEIVSILPIDEGVCTEAMCLERPDYEDGLIAAAALAEHVDAIITRDENAFTSIGIEKFTPQNFIDHTGYEEIDFF